MQSDLFNRGFARMLVRLQLRFISAFNFCFRLYARDRRTLLQYRARTFMKTHKHLFVLSLKRAYYDDQLRTNQSQVYSVADQVRFYTINANIKLGEGQKSWKGWAPLPEGWERSFQNGKLSHLNRKLGTLQEHSPLPKDPFFASISVARQRVLPPGWVKYWDNLGKWNMNTPRTYQKERMRLWNVY